MKNGHLSSVICRSVNATWKYDTISVLYEVKYTTGLNQLFHVHVRGSKELVKHKGRGGGDLVVSEVALRLNGWGFDIRLPFTVFYRIQFL